MHSSDGVRLASRARLPMIHQQAGAPDFVTLPPEEPRPQTEALRLAIERPDGLRLTVTGHFSLAELITTFEHAGASR